MKCEWIEEHVSDMLDGLLTPEEHDNVQAHLEVCGACSALVTGLRQDMMILQGLGDVPVPIGLKLRITEALAKPKLQKNSWRFFLPRFAPVAAAVLISVLSINTIPGYMASRGQLMKEAHIVDDAPRMMVAPAAEPAPDTEVDAKDRAALDQTTENAYAGNGDGVIVTGDMASLSLGAEEETKPSLWVVSSAAGSTVLLLWGAVVYRWSKKV